MKKSWAWFKQLGRRGKTFVVLGSILAIGTASAAISPPPPQSPATPGPQDSTSVHQAVITHKSITETQPVPFQSTTVNDSSLPKGETQVTTTGVNGSETLTYDVTYKDGVQTDKKLVNTTVDVQPVTQVTAIGTYVAPPAPNCPNGTYVNSSGNVVCRPYESPSAPAGATARCVDGSYSFSQHRSGTCSHHGGVAEWL